FNLKGAHAVLLRLLGDILGGHLRRKRRGLARSLEALGSGRRPGNRIALSVGNGDHRIVEGRIDVGNARRNVLALATANAGGFLGHVVPFSRSLRRRNASGYTVI